MEADLCRSSNLLNPGKIFIVGDKMFPVRGKIFSVRDKIFTVRNKIFTVRDCSVRAKYSF